MSVLAIFMASLLGSLHCVGMCGGFVLYYSGASENKIYPHIAYNLGRFIAYVCLGVFAGFIGSAIDDVSGFVGVQSFLSILTGCLLIYWGLRGLAGKFFYETGVTTVFYKKIQALFGTVLKSQEKSWTLRAFVLGLLSAFLPCGWLYSFVLIAASSGSALSGALTMGFFWLGTVPALASFAGVSSLLGSKLRTYSPALTSTLLILAGIFALYGKISLLDFYSTDSNPNQDLTCHNSTEMQSD